MSKQGNRIARCKKLATQFKNKLQKPLNFALRGKNIKHKFIELTVNDIADLIRYCNFIVNGKLQLAYNMQHNYFDTAVYEVIPEQLYNLLQEIAVPEEYENC